MHIPGPRDPNSRPCASGPKALSTEPLSTSDKHVWKDFTKEARQMVSKDVRCSTSSQQIKVTIRWSLAH